MRGTKPKVFFFSLNYFFTIYCGDISFHCYNVAIQFGANLVSFLI
jgi:hypothetical protein